jgi:uncharacterized membrane protein YsdA (DUF1294 family)
MDAGTNPLWLGVLGTYVSVSVLTFIAYAIDKSAAAKGNWRIPENHLHLLSLFGGWPGAWVAQRCLRHKTRKQPFVAIFLFTIALNLAAVGWLLWSISISLA